MENKEIKNILEKVYSIPPLPSAVEKLCRLTDDPETTIYDITRVIANETSLTARILRVANSSFYGLPRKISTIPQAITILGFQAIRNLALGLAVFGYPNKTSIELPLNIKDFWKHSLAVAIAARLLAGRLRLRDTEEAFVAGLLHDIGKVVLMENFKEQYKHILKKTEEDKISLYSIEKDVFGLDHASIGFEICQHWKIPQYITNAVAEHHFQLKEKTIELDKNQIAKIVKISNNIVKIAQVGFSGDNYIEVNFLQMLDISGMSIEYLRQILIILPEEVHKIEEFFELEQEEEMIKTEHHPKSPAVGVIITEPKEKEIVAMVLITLGYTPVYEEQIKNDEIALNGVVVNQFLSPFPNEYLQKKDVPILDFARWQKANKDYIHIPRLKEWLTKNLSHLL